MVEVEFPFVCLSGSIPSGTVGEYASRIGKAKRDPLDPQKDLLVFPVDSKRFRTE